MTSYTNKFGWREDHDVCGEAGAYVVNGRVLDLVVTPTVHGDVEADVVDRDVLFRGRFRTIRGAKIAAVRAASRIINKEAGRA